MNIQTLNDRSPLTENEKKTTPEEQDENLDSNGKKEKIQETITTIQEEAEQLKEEISIITKTVEGNYETAKANIPNEKIQEIQNTTEKLEIKTTNITLSAGADLRKMNLEKAKQIFEEKKTTINNLKNTFNKENQKIIKILLEEELSDKNITNNILDTEKNSKTNTEQHGNRYLIAARILETSIQTLEQLKKQVPEPEIKITIDREKCIIGKSNSYGDIANDRFFDIQMKINISKTEKERKNQEPTTPINTSEEQKTVPVLDKTEITNTESELGGRPDLETKGPSSDKVGSSSNIKEVATTPIVSSPENIIEPTTFQEDMKIIDELQTQASEGGLTEEAKTNTIPPIEETPKTFDLDAMLDTTPTPTPAPAIEGEPVVETPVTPTATPPIITTEQPTMENDLSTPSVAPAFTIPTTEPSVASSTDIDITKQKKIIKEKTDQEYYDNIINNLGNNEEIQKILKNIENNETINKIRAMIVSDIKKETNETKKTQLQTAGKEIIIRNSEIVEQTEQEYNSQGTSNANDVTATFTQEKKTDKQQLGGQGSGKTEQAPREEKQSITIETIPNNQQTDGEYEQIKSTKANTNPNKNKEIFVTTNNELKNKLTPHLNGISFENLINTVNGIHNQEEKEIIQNLLHTGAILQVQEYIGMYKNSEYEDNKATGKIDNNTIKRLAQTKLLEKGEEIKSRLPSDIKNNYDDIFNGRITNNKKSYAIISKEKYALYLFNAEHKLISTHPTLLGKQKGDQHAAPGVRTTPGGNYTINAKAKPGEYTGPGHYLQLEPNDRNYSNANFSIGIHTYPTNHSNRANILENTSANKRVSNGCINTLIQGAIYDNLEVGSIVSIAKEQ